MNDLISRQAAIDAIEHKLAEPAYQHTGKDWYVGMNCAESELYELPSAEPEIIRCKNCKHIRKWRSKESAKKFGQIYECARNVFDCPKPEDYCSRAERKENR